MIAFSRIGIQQIFGQISISIAVGIFWWAHHFIGTAAAMVRNSALESLLG